MWFFASARPRPPSKSYLLGVPVVCLQDVMTNRKVRRDYMSGLYDIKLMKVGAVNQWVKDLNDGTCGLPPRKEDRLPAFDFDKAHDIIMNYRRSESSCNG